jgi:hypothetical protein
MDYRIKKIGDGWEFLPDEEKNKKFQFERLLNNIRRRERRIEKTEIELKELKKELREWKKERTKQHHQLIKYHKHFTPKFSVSLSKNPKVKKDDNLHGSFRTSGNLSWTIYVNVQGGKPKPIYLGTMRVVNEKLDLIEGKEYYKDLFPNKSIPHRKIVTKKIERLVYPLIKEELLTILISEGSLDSFLDNKVKGVKYLDELYKNSDYYEEPKPKKPQKKGKFMVFNPPPSYYKKK